MPPPSLAQLRARIAALEGGAQEGAAVPFAVPEIDAVLPWGGVPQGSLNEIAVGGDDGGAALGFAAVWLGRLAARQERPVLWVTGRDDLYAPGLAALGLPPERLVVARPGRTAWLLWAMEEGLHCSGLAGVLGEVWDLDATAARRLQLAARGSGVTALALNRGAVCGTALTRWRIGPAASEAPAGEGVGGWRWQVELSRCRGRGTGDDGAVARWLVEWSDETRSLRLAAVPGDRSAVPRRHAG